MNMANYGPLSLSGNTGNFIIDVNRCNSAPNPRNDNRRGRFWWNGIFYSLYGGEVSAQYLGRGAYGFVINCQLEQGNNTLRFAAKIISRDKVEMNLDYLFDPMERPSWDDYVKKESDILYTLSNGPNDPGKEHVIRFYDAFFDFPDPQDRYRATENSRTFVIVQELATGGSVDDFLCSSMDPYLFDELQAKAFFKQMYFGLRYASDLNFVNRDIKASNLLIKGGLLKICDWGLAVSDLPRPNGQIGPNGLPVGFVNESIGTEQYKSPEASLNVEYFDPRKSDLFSLGVTNFYLFYRRRPFTVVPGYRIVDSREFKFMENAYKDRVNRAPPHQKDQVRSDYPRNLWPRNPEASVMHKAFLNNLLQINPDLRSVDMNWVEAGPVHDLGLPEGTFLAAQGGGDGVLAMEMRNEQISDKERLMFEDVVKAKGEVTVDQGGFVQEFSSTPVVLRNVALLSSFDGVREVIRKAAGDMVEEYGAFSEYSAEYYQPIQPNGELLETGCENAAHIVLSFTPVEGHPSELYAVFTLYKYCPVKSPNQPRPVLVGRRLAGESTDFKYLWHNLILQALPDGILESLHAIAPTQV